MDNDGKDTTFYRIIVSRPTIISWVVEADDMDDAVRRVIKRGDTIESFLAVEPLGLSETLLSGRYGHPPHA